MPDNYTPADPLEPLNLPSGSVVVGPKGPWVSRADAAKALCVSEATIDRHIKAGKLPSRRMGSRVLIPARAIYANA